MHVEGKINYVGPIQTGMSQRGTQWKKQEFSIVYQEGRYPLSILLPLMNSDIIGKLQIGQVWAVDFDCEVRTYTGKDGQPRMFNSFSIWRNNGMRLINPNGTQVNTGFAAAAPANPIVPQMATAQPATQPQQTNTATAQGADPALPF